MGPELNSLTSTGLHSAPAALLCSVSHCCSHLSIVSQINSAQSYPTQSEKQDLLLILLGLGGVQGEDKSYWFSSGEQTEGERDNRLSIWLCSSFCLMLPAFAGQFTHWA